VLTLVHVISSLADTDNYNKY